MARGFFETQSPVYTIFAAFFLFALPLCVLGIAEPQFLEKTRLGLLYFIAIGNTHFLLTFALYFQSDNLRYFGSSPRNRLIYFLIPILIFVFFDLYRSLEIAWLYPGFDRALTSAVRFFNFYHAGRQTFGVLQLFKRRARVDFPSWMRQAESGYCYLLIALMMLTFLYGGQFTSHPLPMQVLLGLAGVGFVSVLAGFARAGRRACSWGPLAAPVAYFLLQSVSAGFAVYSTALYIYALAMHYVEYHVVMFPRCFHSRLGNKPVDRIFGALRASKLVFYIVLLNLAGIAAALTATSGRHWPPSANLALSLFDGLFVFHYFVEAFVWKFGNAFYRETALPFYFDKRLAPSPKIA